METKIFGLSAALITPFNEDGSVDHEKLVKHSAFVTTSGCDGITLFGTTGEGYGIEPYERTKMLNEVLSSVSPDKKVTAGVLSTGIETAAQLASEALVCGAHSILLAPPYFLKGVDDDGLFKWFSAVFERMGKSLRDIILYNIPSQTAVPISTDLVGKLRAAYPGVIIGIKDSSGDWNSSADYLKYHGDIAILIGDERQLPRGMQHGAQGAICGLANFMAQDVANIIHHADEGAKVTDVVNLVLSNPIIPTVKLLTSLIADEPSYNLVRPPLAPLDDAKKTKIGSDFAAICDSR